MEDLVAGLLEQKELKLKLNKENAKQKFYINMLSSSNPCCYSLFADHTIDVQCSGAHDKVPAQLLMSNAAKHK
jgi:hypothetical protein